MSDETIQQDRSPRSPTLALEEAIETTRKLHQAARMASIKPDVAVKAIGYSGVNGAAMTTLATLAQYGLVDRTGGNVAVTPLAVKIFHPTSPAQKAQSIQEAASTPAVFRELLKGFEECTAEVVTGHLIQNRFTPERAKKVAQVFIANRSFVQPFTQEDAEDESNDLKKSGGMDRKPLSAMPTSPNVGSPHPVAAQATFPSVAMNSEQKMLAQYNIPLGGNQAQLTFIGQALTPDDFDELIEFVSFTKRQFVRRLKSTVPPQITPAIVPLSKIAIELREALISRRPIRFTSKEAEEHSVLDMSCHEEFVDAWKELIQAGEVVCVHSQEPKLYSVKEHA